MEWLVIGALAYLMLSNRNGAGAAESPAATTTGGAGFGIAAPVMNPPGTPGMDAPSSGCSAGYIPNPVCLATNRIEIDPANPSCGKCVPLFTPQVLPAFSSYYRPR